MGTDIMGTLHKTGHAILKPLFMLVLAGSSALFFIGSAVPQPPALLVVVIGAGLGLAVEWSYFVVSCDLTQAITEKDTGGIWRSGLYTVIGAGASWFLFVNAALHVGWAPVDDLIGLSRQQWAMLAGAFIVCIVLALSIRTSRPEKQTDLQAIARAVLLLLPDGSNDQRLDLLAIIASAAAKQQKALPAPTGEAPAPIATSAPAMIAQPGGTQTTEGGVSAPLVPFRADREQEHTSNYNGHKTTSAPGR